MIPIGEQTLTIGDVIWFVLWLLWKALPWLLIVGALVLVLLLYISLQAG